MIIKMLGQSFFVFILKAEKLQKKAQNVNGDRRNRKMWYFLWCVENR